MASESKDKEKEKKGKGGIVVKGINDMAVRFFKMLQSGSRRRDRRICHERTGNVNPSDGLY